MARKGYPAEFRRRALDLVAAESLWRRWCGDLRSVAAKAGCTDETVRTWVRRADVDGGRRTGVTSDERARLKELEREVRELWRANGFFKPALLFLAIELDGRI